MGMKLEMEGETPHARYLIKWKSGSPVMSEDGEALTMTWEPGSNLSEDVVREYEDRWWAAARKVTSPRLSLLI